MNMQTLSGSPHPTSETLLDYPAANNSISQKYETVKKFQTKKQSESEFLTDLQQIHQVYAQSVYQNHSADKRVVFNISLI
jgi:hypothetical protein